MSRTEFERLEMYELSQKLADEVWRIVIGWKPLARQIVGQQPVRAADSIGANIAEGVGRESFQDNRRFVNSDELAPRLNAYLKSIGRVPVEANN